MTPAVRLDQAALRDFLDRTFGRREGFSLVKADGGQSNPTFFVTHGERRMVLRKKPAGDIRRGAHAIEREYRVLSALAPTAVPVPRVLLFHDDPALLGTSFYLMERVDGRVFADSALPGVEAVERRALYMAAADALGMLHAVDPLVVGLSDYGRPGSYFERQIARWTRQWRESSIIPIPHLEWIAAWLPANLPPDDGLIRIAHGDFRLGNLLFHPTEARVAAILDWELSTLGHPLADLGFCCMPWHTSPDEYGGLLGLDLAALGIPSESEFLARYFAASATPGRLLPFHVAFALFRFAIIFLGIAERARTGSAVSENAAMVGQMAVSFARRAVEVASRPQGFPK